MYKKLLASSFDFLFEPVISLLYPNLCAGCNSLLMRNEGIICTKCRFMMPKTDDYLYLDNPIAKKFWGRLPLGRAATYLKFDKKSVVQSLIHQLKYKNREDVGILIGNHFGYLLAQNPDWIPDIIIPVPLHPDRLRSRGYNQSASFAQGLSQAMNCPYSDAYMIRTKNTISQTKMSRSDRHENMKNVFKISNKQAIIGKKILLVDDVITTGATLDICGQVLLDAQVSRIDIVAIACA